MELRPSPFSHLGEGFGSSLRKLHSLEKALPPLLASSTVDAQLTQAKDEGQAQGKLWPIINQLGPLPDSRNDSNAGSGQSIR
ncbi:hypothetical protein D8674_003601 [Pyrus ussuriensis x Pyrus communis]|uniref:Uncharacterized protein n=1 Tax=Pyrus ussuriensis x Pyrus communis TaxID=2448454 RepID=A0A5N5FHJ9_9ROSA|nr:hypothetical protein D8674_003601 [Pyrus ussuriensis x Pyrus communis]